MNNFQKDIKEILKKITHINEEQITNISNTNIEPDILNNQKGEIQNILLDNKKEGNIYSNSSKSLEQTQIQTTLEKLEEKQIKELLQLKDIDFNNLVYLTNNKEVSKNKLIFFIKSLNSQKTISKIESMLNSGSLTVPQELRIIDGFRNILSWLYTKNGETFFKENFKRVELFDLDKREELLNENYENVNEYLNDITLQEINNIDSTLLQITQLLKKKINSTIIEEGAWFDEYILKCATEKEKITLLKFTKKNDMIGFKNSLKNMINKNNEELGIPHVFSKDNESYSFTKATGGLPDVVLKTREGGIHFCYANSFENSYMESDQAERHSAILLETMRKMNWNKNIDTKDFYKEFQSVHNTYLGEVEQRNLWRNIISNKKNYSDNYSEVRSQFSISNYQYIGHLKLIEQVLFLQHHNLVDKKEIEEWKQNNKEEYEVMKEKINLIKVLLQSLVLEAQEFHNFTLGNDEKIYNFSNEDKKIFKSVSVNSPTIMGEQEKSISNPFFRNLFEKGSLKSTLLDLIDMDNKSIQLTNEANNIENEDTLKSKNQIGYWGQTLKLNKTSMTSLFDINDFKKDTIEEMDSFLMKFIILNQSGELRLALIEGLLHLLLGKYDKEELTPNEKIELIELIKIIIGNTPIYEKDNIIEEFLGKTSSRNSKAIFTSLKFFKEKNNGLVREEENKKLQEEKDKLQEEKKKLMTDLLENEKYNLVKEINNEKEENLANFLVSKYLEENVENKKLVENQIKLLKKEGYEILPEKMEIELQEQIEKLTKNILEENYIDEKEQSILTEQIKKEVRTTKNYLR